MSWRTVQRVVQFQATLHFRNGAPQDIHISPGVMTAQLGLGQPKSRFHMVQ